MENFVARQAIFNRNLKVFAYELLFRSGQENVYVATDADKATSSVITDSFLTIGLESLTRGKRAFINFTKNLLMDETAAILPKDSLVIEILEDIIPDEGIIAACTKLKENGYTLALDDFVFDEVFEPLIKLADIIKVDFRLSGLEEGRALIEKYGLEKIKFLAEKVETQDEFDQALGMGYTYFQGYFFSKPVIVASKDIPGYKINHINIIHEVNRPDVNFNRIENIIKQDVTISYKLLKFINSAFFSFSSKIQSIKQALVMLGIDEFRKWVSIVVLKGMGDDKPDELMVISIVRAKFCEFIAEIIGLKKRGPELFFMGMFSVIDTFMGRPMEEILGNLPLEDDIKDALSGSEGRLRNVYELMLANEKGEWDKIFEYADKLGIDKSKIPGIYVKALESANEIFTSLPSQ